jgi:TPR repeat protein
LKWYRKAAVGLEDDEREEEHVAQRRLGFAYQNGLFDQTVDDKEALKWYRKAAKGVATTTRKPDSLMPTSTASSP